MQTLKINSHKIIDNHLMINPHPIVLFSQNYQIVDSSPKTKLITSQYPLPIIWFKGTQGRCEISLSKVHQLLGSRMGDQ